MEMGEKGKQGRRGRILPEGGPGGGGGGGGVEDGARHLLHRRPQQVGGSLGTAGLAELELVTRRRCNSTGDFRRKHLQDS